MEQEILDVFQEIRGYIFIMMVILAIWATFNIIQIISETYQTFIQMRVKPDFSTLANKLFDSANYSALETRCKEAIEINSDDYMAIFWLAKALYASGKQLESRKYFQQVGLLMPSWNNDYVEPYLNVIKDIEIANKSVKEDN